MSNETRLPIESYPELMQEYGRAMAWINMIDYLLNLVIRVRGNLLNSDYELVGKILDDMIFGRKIAITENIIDSKIRKKLNTLNEKRLFLAHGITGEEVPADNPSQKTGKLIINHKKKQVLLDKDFLDDTTKIAQELSHQLQALISKR